MKKFFQALLLFSALLAVGYTCLIYFWGEVMPLSLRRNLKYIAQDEKFTRIRMEEARAAKKVDLLFLGSSHAYRSFDNRIFSACGYSTFNLGTSSQTPIQTEVLLKRYLDNLDPRIVIYEVFPFTFCADGVESSLLLISSDRNDFLSLKLAFYQGSPSVLNTLIYSVCKEILQGDSRIPAPRTGKEDEYIPGGFVESKRTTYLPKKHPRSRWELNEMQLAKFSANIKRLKRRGIRVLLIQAPVTSAYYDSIENNAEIDSLMSSIGEYYNFNELISLEDSIHFYDSDHLNQSGVAAFDKAVLEMVFDCDPESSQP